MIQEHLDKQEPISNTSGHLEQYRTGQNLSNMAHSAVNHPNPWHFGSCQTPPPKMHLSTKFEWPSGILPMWAPTPKNLNSHN